MIKCTRRIEFDAGHRIIGHQNKCQFLHGHRYILEVTAAAKNTNKLGMIVDFGEIKLFAKKWIDDNFDHSLILHQDDKEIGEKIASWTGQKIYYMQDNPTAENIALHLKNDIFPKIFTGQSFIITSLKLFETPNCFVEV
ncbi:MULTISPECIES: 6-pyruvoyl trahydropterin synthase family protein [unclassified Rickettsia]|uniref:6-pyruvoyl trahydropterin synthase family protein n=1 Tax=unclassified Rickettsia TaxID=114295 RepID=UPI00209EBBA8|nr:6-pyruvoyl tetrahydropterin synthase family protein [Rickettsia endosymbiont of Ceutorhynchus assimilis]